jgi:hypothetical protein
MIFLVFYGCETWSLTLRVFENRVLRGIFGPKWNEVTGEWRKIRNEEFNDLYSSPNTISGDANREEMGRECRT